MSEKLIFIYNADSGKLNAYMDSLHKIFKPSTYPCSLCDLTYGIFKENKDWKQFRENSDLEMEFYHLDEFKTEFGSKFLSKYSFPIILITNQNDMDVLVSTEEMDGLKSAEELIGVISKRTKRPSFDH
tara:strand:+ start:52 stop:435 length:384 start_codon:yes stop_codon:yes gene_type:complete